MNVFSDFLLNLTQYMGHLRMITISDVLDILIIAFIIYKSLALVQRANASRLASGVAIFLLALGLSEILSLTMVNSLLSSAVEIGLIALIILFQPELRRLLERMGSGRLVELLRGESTEVSMDASISQVALACAEMARTRTGALIVFERVNSLKDYSVTGTLLDAGVSSELLRNIFYDKAPMHDGAVIVSEGRILAAGCMLPLSQSTNLSRDLGMRHRAAIGMSENSDAVVAIVSEETGYISLAIDGMLKRHLTAEMLEELLVRELVHEEDEEKESTLIRMVKRLAKPRDKKDDENV